MTEINDTVIPIDERELIDMADDMYFPLMGNAADKDDVVPDAPLLPENHPDEEKMKYIDIYKAMEIPD